MFFFLFCFFSIVHSLHLKFDKNYSFFCEVSNFNIIQDSSEIRYLLKSTPVIVFKNQQKCNVNSLIEKLHLDKETISFSHCKKSISNANYFCIHSSSCKKTLFASQCKKKTKKINLENNDILLTNLKKISLIL